VQKVEEIFLAPTTPESLVAELQRVFQAYGYRLNRMMPQDGSEGFVSYTLATRPVGRTGAIIFVSDAAAGSKFQGWDGSAWVPLG